MARSSEVQPSLEGIFQVLAQAPRDKLVCYKDKLSGTRQDQRSHRLLHAMILLSLKREAEAQKNLETLRDDPVAVQIFQSHWGSAKTNKANPIPPNQDAEVGLAVAQIYSLLVEEKLCSPLIRDKAVAASQSHNVGKDQLKHLEDEALEKCKMSTLRTNNFSSLEDSIGKPPAQRMVSDPVPIQSSSDPQPLRSTGTPTSLVSHLEISQSLTVPFLDLSIHEHSVAETSKLCGSASHSSARDDEKRNSLETPTSARSKSGAKFSEKREELKNRKSGDFRGSGSSSSDLPDSKVTQVPEGTTPCFVEYIQPTKQGPEGSLPHGPQSASTLQSDSTTSTRSSVEDTSSSKQTSRPVPHSVSNSSSSPQWTRHSSTDPQPDAKEFFTFVILHASEDETIACRVKDQLESMGVSNGATYAEDFLIPGHCQLTCFQNALDNSAFTLLLLSENFKSRFCAYQTSTALMDSFTRFCKTNTVIPFISKERPVKKYEMPTLLVGLIPLDENSPIFAKRVKNTFTAKAIQERKKAWSYRRQIQERAQLQEQYREYQRTLQQLSVLNMNAPSAMPFPGPLGDFPGLQVPYGYMPPPNIYPPPGTSQPTSGPDQPSLSQPFLVSLGSGGPPPHLIIQNAQMVQIGDYNHMQVERTNATLGAAEEEGSPS